MSLFINDQIYRTLNYPGQLAGGKTLLTGIRGHKDIVYISGFFEPDNITPPPSFVYKGTLTGDGIWSILNFPSSPGVTVTATNLYGPNILGPDCIQVVGNYTTLETGTTTLGCLYEGPLDGSGSWTTITPTSEDPVLNTIAHSTMGGLVVGNYDTQVGQSKAFIYNIKTRISHDIIIPDSTSTTAYGIWQNDKHCYTICGGYLRDTEVAYLIDYKHHKLKNLQSYSFDNNPITSPVTHFNGITTDGKNGYNLTGDWIGISDKTQLGFFTHVKRNKHGKFARTPKWISVSFPNQPITSGNSVFEKTVIGVYASITNDIVNGYISIQL